MNKQIIFVNPKNIKKLSPISGCANSRKEKAIGLNCEWKDGFFYGDWDKIERTLQESLTKKDYDLFIENKKSVYNWKPLYDSIQKKGYVQNTELRYIEIGIGRTGELFLVDGRHRLFLSQLFNISSVPVHVLDIHPEYKCDNLKYIQNEVIPEFVYNKISNQWNEEIKKYHHFGTIEHRYGLVKNVLPLLKNKNVLEIGANSGMMMWSIMKHARHLIELEVQEKYYEQCLITQKNLSSMHDFNVNVYNRSFKDYILNNSVDEINALYVSFVLYHMSDEEINLLKTKVIPNCDVVIVPNRNKERGKQKNSYHLNRPEEIEKLLKEAGMTVTIDYPDKGYSTIVGKNES